MKIRTNFTWEQQVIWRDIVISTAGKVVLLMLPCFTYHKQSRSYASVVMSSNKRRKTATSAAAETFEKAIDSVKDAHQCGRIRIKLMQLLEKANAKVAELKDADKQNGLKYEGEDSVECKCGGTIDPDGEYAGACGRCQDNKGKVTSCIECLTKCDICEETCCEDCVKECGCCDKTYCHECSEECERCHDEICNECTMSYGYHDGSVCNLRRGYCGSLLDSAALGTFIALLPDCQMDSKRYCTYNRGERRRIGGGPVQVLECN